MSWAEGWFEFAIPVRFADVDQMGHINNVSYVRYFEEVRLGYWRDLVMTHGVSAASWILAEVHAAFKAQGSYPDTALARTRTAAFLPKGWIWEHEIASQRSGDVLARGWSRQVTFDYTSGRSGPLPGELRKAIEAFEKREIPAVERWP